MIFVIVQLQIYYITIGLNKDGGLINKLATVNVRDVKHAWRTLALHDKRGARVRDIRQEKSLKDTNLWRVTYIWDRIGQGRHRASSTTRLASKRPVTYKKQAKNTIDW